MKSDRTEDLHFRVTPDEKEQIREKAEKAGLSVSDYLRRQALSKKVTVVPPDLFKEYQEMCGGFGRFGNNLNQVARHLNSGGSQDMVIQWLNVNKRDFDDIVMKLKIMYEKKLAA